MKILKIKMEILSEETAVEIMEILENDVSSSIECNVIDWELKDPKAKKQKKK